MTNNGAEQDQPLELSGDIGERLEVQNCGQIVSDEARADAGGDRLPVGHGAALRLSLHMRNSTDCQKEWQRKQHPQRQKHRRIRLFEVGDLDEDGLRGKHRCAERRQSVAGDKPPLLDAARRQGSRCWIVYRHYDVLVLNLPAFLPGEL